MLAILGIVAGVILGIPAGMAIQHARHVVRSYQNSKTSLPGQKEAASSAETRGAIWLVALGGIGILMLLLILRSR